MFSCAQVLCCAPKNVNSPVQPGTTLLVELTLTGIVLSFLFNVNSGLAQPPAACGRLVGLPGSNAHVQRLRKPIS